MRSPLSLWHLLSLDAPTVAALWLIFIARTAHIALPWTAAAAMFTAVWMLYATDRLLDARAAGNELQQRHHFHLRHRRQFLAAIFIAAIALAFLLHRTPAPTLHLYALLATLLAAWLVLIHASPIPTEDTHRLPKELVVGIFFPAAVFIPVVSRTAHPVAAFLPSALLLGAVCTLNCLFIYAWEHPLPEHAAWPTRIALHQLKPLTAALIAVAVLAAIFSTTTTRPIAIACALSAVLLLMIDANKNRLSALHLRAAADLTLLTPLPLLVLMRP